MRAHPVRIQIAAGLAIAAWLFATPALSQNTWYVDDDGSPQGTGSSADPFPTIQRAITSTGTQEGDTILVRPGTYRERVNLTRGLYVIGEAGAAQTIVDAMHRGPTVTVRHQSAHESRLEGFTLRNGTGRFIASRGESQGGGIFCVNSRLVVAACTITGNATRIGGGDSAIVGSGGGLFAGVGADVELIACTVEGNDATRGGGIALDRGKVAVLGGTVRANRALGGEFDPGRGGGFHALSGSRLELEHVDVRTNLALGNEYGLEALGGGLRLEAGSSCLIESSTIAANDSGGFSLGYGDLSGFGGGVSSMARGSEFSMYWSDVRGNWGNNGGGGVHGKGELIGCTIEQNRGQFGGGVHAIDMTLSGCILRSNLGSVSGSYDWGGGIYVGPGRRGVLEGCELDSNFAWGRGAGGFGGTYVGCDIHDNFAAGDAETGFVVGGGVYGGDLLDCRVWNNTAEQQDYFDAEGGGLYDCAASFCIVRDNVADFFGAASLSQLERSTIANNVTVIGSEAVGASTVHDSIVRFNVPADLDGATNATWSAVPAGTPGVGNVFDDPLLWNVGGRDYRLQPSSPCIDAGDPTSPPDPDGSRADMGAMPYGG